MTDFGKRHEFDLYDGAFADDAACLGRPHVERVADLRQLGPLVALARAARDDAARNFGIRGEIKQFVLHGVGWLRFGE